MVVTVLRRLGLAAFVLAALTAGGRAEAQNLPFDAKGTAIFGGWAFDFGMESNGPRTFIGVGWNRVQATLGLSGGALAFPPSPDATIDLGVMWTALPNQPMTATALGISFSNPEMSASLGTRLGFRLAATPMPKLMLEANGQWRAGDTKGYLWLTGGFPQFIEVGYGQKLQLNANTVPYLEGRLGFPYFANATFGMTSLPVR